MMLFGFNVGLLSKVIPTSYKQRFKKKSFQSSPIENTETYFYLITSQHHKTKETLSVIGCCRFISWLVRSLHNC